jgi:hypothetical protein
MSTSSEIENQESKAVEGQQGPLREREQGCCGGAAPKGLEACCALDAEVKSAGGPGCGCGPKAESRASARRGCC